MVADHQGSQHQGGIGSLRTSAVAAHFGIPHLSAGMAQAWATDVTYPRSCIVNGICRGLRLGKTGSKGCRRQVRILTRPISFWSHATLNPRECPPLSQR